MDGDAMEEDGFGAGVSEERAEVGEDVEMDSKPERVEPALTPLDGIDDATASAISATTTVNDTIIQEEEPVDNLPASVEAQAAVQEALDDIESKMTGEARDASDDPLKLAQSVKKTDSKATNGNGDATGELDDEDADGEVDADGDGEVDMLDIVPDAVKDSNNPEIKGEVILGEIVPPEVPLEDAKPLDPLKTANNDPLPTSTAAALKDGSANPTLVSADGQPADTDEVDADERLRTARSTLLNLTNTSLTFDLGAFSLPSSSKPEPSDDPVEEDFLSAPFTPSSTLDRHLFSDLFGDSSTYSMTIPASENAILQGRIDRRIDDATVAGGKLAHTSRLLEIRPVLVSTLQPGKKRKGDEWEDLGDLWGGNEMGDYGEPRGEVFTGGTTLFARKKVKESVHPPTCSKPNQPRNYEIRLAATIWQNDDDIVLQRLCHQFPFNWQLISDAFNTSRRTLSIDRRSPWDCFQRWNKKWNPNPEKESDKKDGPTSEPGMIDGAEAGPSTPGGTATTAASNKKGANKMIPAILDPKFEGSKKKLRHAKLYEAMRKTAKRRDMTNRKPNLKEPRRVLTAHESHNQYQGRVGGPTPGELSKHKQDREQAFAEAQRANSAERDQAYRRYQQEQALRQQQQQQQGGPRPNGAGTPPAGQHPNQVNRQGPSFPQNGGPPQQQGQQNGRAMQPGGVPPQAAALNQQYQLLQAQQRANQGGRAPGQQQQQMMPPRQSGPDRKSSPASMGSPSMQAAGISRPGSTSSQGGVGGLFQNARGDSPAEIAHNMVQSVPAELAARIQEPLVINNHVITPDHIRTALANKVRNDAKMAQAAVAKAAASST